MSSLILPPRVRADVKPGGDIKESFLTAGLCGVFFPAYYPSVDAYFKSNTLTATVGSPTNVGTKYGLARNYPGSAYDHYRINDRLSNIKNYTVVVVGYGWDFSTWGGSFAKTTNSTTTNSIHIQRDNGTNAVVIQHGTLSVKHPTLSYDKIRDSLVAHAFSYNGSVSRLFADGVKNSEISFTSNPLTSSSGAGRIKLGSSRDSAIAAGKLVAVLLFDRCLEDSQICSLTIDPWQIFKPRKSVLYFGGGTPTNYPSAADSGSITLTGSAANGVRALAGVAASGSITLTGSAANAVRALAGVAASGSITLTGSNAAALRTWLGVAGAGSITLTGSDAAGVKAGSGAYTSAADAGSITLSGSAAVGTYDRLAAAGAGIITLTGSDASGIRNIPATAEAGSIVLTGSAAVGIRTWLTVAEAGSITLSGSDAEGVYGGAMTLTPADLDAIAAAVWADPAAVAAHAKLDEIIARITC